MRRIDDNANTHVLRSISFMKATFVVFGKIIPKRRCHSQIIYRHLVALKLLKAPFSDCCNVSGNDDNRVSGVEEGTKGGVATQLSSILGSVPLSDNVRAFLALRETFSTSC